MEIIAIGELSGTFLLFMITTTDIFYQGIELFRGKAFGSYLSPPKCSPTIRANKTSTGVIIIETSTDN